MTKSNKIHVSIVAVMVVGLILGIGIFATGPIFAEGGDEVKKESPKDKFVSRVASILGIDENDLTGAMGQVRKEMEDEAVKSVLDKKVESGLITQDEANKYYEWYQAKPEGVEGFGMHKGFGDYRLHKRFGGWHGKCKGYGMKEKSTSTPEPKIEPTKL